MYHGGKQMNKEELKNFPANPYFNIISMVVFTFIGMGGIYYLTINQVNIPIITASEIKLYLFFAILNLGFLILQFMRKVKNRINIIVFAIAAAFYIMSLLMRQVFRGNLVVFVVAQGLSLGATLFIAMSLEFALIQLITGPIMSDDENVILLEEDMNLFLSSIVLYILFIGSVPLLAFERPNFSWMWSLLWSGVIISFLAFFTFFSYRNVTKEAVVGKDELVLEYRSIILYLLASQEKMREYDKLQMTTKNKIVGLEMEKENKFADRAHFEAIEESKSKLLKEIKELNKKIKRYDIKLIKKSIVECGKKLREIDQQVWKENFATDHERLIETIQASELQLETAKTELEQSEEQAAEVRQALQEAKFQFEDSHETQTALKEKRTNLVHRKSDYLDEIQNGDLDDKELRKLQAQVDKIVIKEKEYDQKIQKMEMQIVKQGKQKEKLKKQLYTLLKTEIPDYQYAITTLTKTIKTSEAEKAVIETKFKKALDSHFEFNQMKKTILAAEEEEKEYDDLIEQREAKQKIVDIDSLQEMARIDEQIQSIDRKIDKELKKGEELTAQYQRVIDLIQEFTANKKRILKKLYIEK